MVDGGFSVVIPSAPNGTAPIAGQSKSIPESNPGFRGSADSTLAYVVLTGCNTTVTDETVAAGPAILEVS